MDKIIGQYKVTLETILDPEGEVIYHKVKSPIFKGKVLELMYEDDLTEDVIKKHIQTTDKRLYIIRDHTWYGAHFEIFVQKQSDNKLPLRKK